MKPWMWLLLGLGAWYLYQQKSQAPMTGRASLTLTAGNGYSGPDRIQGGFLGGMLDGPVNDPAVYR